MLLWCLSPGWEGSKAKPVFLFGPTKRKSGAVAQL